MRSWKERLLDGHHVLYLWHSENLRIDEELYGFHHSTPQVNTRLAHMDRKKSQYITSFQGFERKLTIGG